MQVRIASDATRTLALRAWVAGCYALTLLVLVPLLPSMPAANIDASWEYAMNVGVAQHLRFGQDLVFTFGPLASAFTLQYSPATDTLMLVASWILATAVFLGFALLARPGSAAWLVTVPFALSQLATRDPVFLVLPLMLVLNAEKDPWEGWRRQGVFFIAGACALLPLVKGSMTPAVLLCSLLAFLALWQRARRDAVALVVLQLLAMSTAWILAGQSAGDLPQYFVAQIPIVLGYTEAMALVGPTGAIVAYLIAALVLVVAIAGSARPARPRVVLAMAAVLFLCMKAAFVRHDVHGLIAAGMLLLVGSLVVFQHRSRTGLAALAVAIASWAFIVDPFESIFPEDRVARFTRALDRSVDGLEVRVLHPGWLPEWFRVANEGIARREPLPRTPDTVSGDLYPSNLAVLLANGGRWRPRPIPQSYSAYTPSLAELNRAHLQSSGPDRLYFGFDPIDGRYPSLDDGSSWPVILERYQPVGLAGNYAVLDRRSVPRQVGIGKTLVAGPKVIGESVAIPDGPLIWAQVDLAPTLLGRIASVVFKLPELSLVVHYTDGKRKAYRFIPAMARSGFLLSPTVATPADFVALQSPQAREALSSKVPLWFELQGGAMTELLWRGTYGLELAPLQIGPVPARADPVPGTPAGFLATANSVPRP